MSFSVVSVSSWGQPTFRRAPSASPTQRGSTSAHETTYHRRTSSGHEIHTVDSYSITKMQEGPRAFPAQDPRGGLAVGNAVAIATNRRSA